MLHTHAATVRPEPALLEGFDDAGHPTKHLHSVEVLSL